MKISVRVLIIIVLLGVLSMVTPMIGCQQQAADSQSAEKMKALADRNIEMWNTGNLELIDELYTPEFVRYNVDISKEVKGIDAFKGYVTSTRATYPDFNVKIDELISKENKLVVLWTVTGTNTGPIIVESGQLPPTGKKVEISGASVVTVAEEKIMEERAYWNYGAGLTQLGFTVTPPSPTNQE